MRLITATLFGVVIFISCIDSYNASEAATKMKEVYGAFDGIMDCADLVCAPIESTYFLFGYMRSLDDQLYILKIVFIDNIARLLSVAGKIPVVGPVFTVASRVVKIVGMQAGNARNALQRFNDRTQSLWDSVEKAGDKCFKLGMGVAGIRMAAYMGFKNITEAEEQVQKLPTNVNTQAALTYETNKIIGPLRLMSTGINNVASFCSHWVDVKNQYTYGIVKRDASNSKTKRSIEGAEDVIYPMVAAAKSLHDAVTTITGSLGPVKDLFIRLDEAMSVKFCLREFLSGEYFLMAAEAFYDLGIQAGEAIADVATDIGEGVVNVAEDIGGAVARVFRGWKKRRRRRSSNAKKLLFTKDDFEKIFKKMTKRELDTIGQILLDEKHNTISGNPSKKGIPVPDICISVKDVLDGIGDFIDLLLKPVNDFLSGVIGALPGLEFIDLPDFSFMDDLTTDMFWPSGLNMNMPLNFDVDLFSKLKTFSMTCISDLASNAKEGNDNVPSSCTDYFNSLKPTNPPPTFPSFRFRLPRIRFGRWGKRRRR